MLRSPKMVAAAIGGVVALTACTSVPQEAIEAEQFSQATLDDPKVPIGPGSTIAVEAFEWGFRIDGVAVDGAVTVDFVNVGGATHNFRIDNAAGEVKKVEAPAGESDVGELQLFGGATYTYYCDIPGHRGEGMEGEIHVYLEGEAPAEGDDAVDDAETDADAGEADVQDEVAEDGGDLDTDVPASETDAPDGPAEAAPSEEPTESS